MFSVSLIAVALAGAAMALTPLGFEPASAQELQVSFGNILAVNGTDIPRASACFYSPNLTSPNSFSIYLFPSHWYLKAAVRHHAILMVDPDVPSSTPGGPSSTFLHWIQPGLVSSCKATQVAGQQIFELTHPNNVSSFASYVQPSPPNKTPVTRRYTQLLLNDRKQHRSVGFGECWRQQKKFQRCGCCQPSWNTDCCSEFPQHHQPDGAGGREFESAHFS